MKLIIFYIIFAVTTVDSGSKALEFLGWQEQPPSVSPGSHQVGSQFNQKPKLILNLLYLVFYQVGPISEC